MPVPHPATLGKSVTLGKSETTTAVLVLVSDTVQRIVTVRYNTVLADSDKSTVPYGPAAYGTGFLYRILPHVSVIVQNLPDTPGTHRQND